MNAMKKSLNIPLTLFAVAALLVVVYQAGAMRHSQAEPISAAVVDLQRVLESLEERGAADARLEAQGAALQAEEERRLADIQQMELDLENVHVPGTPAFEAAQDEYQQAAIAYRVWREFEMQKLEREKGLIFKQLYQSVKEAVAEMAQGRYDIVFMNDSIQDVMQGTEAQVGQQISARRVLYADTALDITSDLIRRMNNDFQAGN